MLATPRCAASVMAYSCGNAREASTGAFAGSMGAAIGAPSACRSRVFPPEYGASARPTAEPINLHGNSLWGQTIDSWERVKPDMAEAVLAALPAMDPQAPWDVFPRPVLTTAAPIESFERFYGI